MQLHVRLFGPEAALLGRRETVVEATGTPLTCAGVRAQLARRHPELVPLLAGCRFAVNHAFAAEEQVVKEGDEVALVGQVSGG